MFDNEIVSLEDREDGVCVQFKHGPERQFDLVVGADGLHSQVRKLVFGPQQQFEKNLGYAVAAFEVLWISPARRGCIRDVQPSRTVARAVHHA